MTGNAKAAKAANGIIIGILWLCALCVPSYAAAIVAAQEHGYTPADIENGSRIYQSSCAGCHGPTGDMVPGIELMRGQFRRASTDTEIIRIIRTGIPGTTMPPSSFSETQAGTIVAYLRSIAPAPGRAAAAADAPRG